ncbi:hypothetical protein DL96DRAFT_1718947 [Flagelloscypha sp. PMI_526]|nr:hypothetical protein DL96DRAFT_1718947 [Flagelloscypha sp. PMI_526]
MSRKSNPPRTSSKKRKVDWEGSSGSYDPPPPPGNGEQVSTSTFRGSLSNLSGTSVSRSSVTTTSTVRTYPTLPTLGSFSSEPFDWSQANFSSAGSAAIDSVLDDGQEDDEDSEVEEAVELRVQRKRYDTSDNPMRAWKAFFQQFLDGMMSHKGRHFTSRTGVCLDCGQMADPSYLCEDCEGGLSCAGCLVKSHARLPMHNVKIWSESAWRRTTLADVGLIYQMGHNGAPCPFPDSATSRMVVIEQNGIHRLLVRWCKCSHSIVNRLEQCLRHSWYPSSCDRIQTCATFRCLDTFRLLNVSGGVNATDFLAALARKVDGASLNNVLTRSKQFRIMARQYAWLLRAKRAGYGCGNRSLSRMAAGSCAVECWACPQEGKNLPLGWEEVSPEYKFLFMLFLSLDANFRLKNKLRENAHDDPAIVDGVGYFVMRELYNAYVLKHAGTVEVSTCAAFHAMRWDDRQTTGLRSTGIGACACSHHEVIRPMGAVSYDIACQWRKNLDSRALNLPPSLQRPPTAPKIQSGIPVWHASDHVLPCRMANSLSVKDGTGRTDGEGMERVWSRNNGMASSTKEQGEGSHRDNLDDKFDYENTTRNYTLVNRLPLKLGVALEETQIQERTFEELDSAITPEQRSQWLTELEDWKAGSSEVNPYVLDQGDELTEAHVRRDLLEEETKERLDGNATGLHTTSATSFLILGLDIESAQVRLRFDAENTSSFSNAELIKLEKRRYQLASSLRIFREAQRIYMPGALIASEGDLSSQTAISVEHTKLWLPSQLSPSIRQSACAAQLPEKELKLRHGQMQSTLRDLQKRLYSRKIVIEKRNLRNRGQRETTRSGTLIASISAKIHQDCERYRSIRSAILALATVDELPRLTSVYQPLERSDLVVPDEDREDSEGRRRLNAAGGERGSRVGAVGSEVSRGPSFIWEAARLEHFDENGDQAASWLTACCRVEWLKARARMTRWREEVLLLREEMRRTLRYLEWRSKWWQDQVPQSPPVLLAEIGAAAYAAKQASIMKTRATQWRKRWSSPFREAPKLKKDETSELLRFLDQYEEELKKASVTDDDEKIKKVVHFVDTPLQREWEALDSFSGKNWDKFKEELKKNYPEALHDVHGAMEGLTKLSHRYNGINGYSKTMLATYSREFKTEWHKAKDALGEREGVLRYLSSLSEPFREKILSRLQTQREVKRQTNASNTTPSDEWFKVEEVIDMAYQLSNEQAGFEAILNMNKEETRFLLGRLTSDISPLRPLVKVEAKDVSL